MNNLIKYVPYLFWILTAFFGILLFLKATSNQIKYNTSILKDHTNRIDFKKIKKIINDSSTEPKEKRDIKTAYLYIRLTILMAVLFLLSAIIITIK
jgi:cytochrome b subunit of formate dehydrogenase